MWATHHWCDEYQLAVGRDDRNAVCHVEVDEMTNAAEQLVLGSYLHRELTRCCELSRILAKLCMTVKAMKTKNQIVNDGVAHSKNQRKCEYHMTFDPLLDLEHTLDAGLPGDHRVQVWSRYSHLPGRISDFRASTKVSVSCDLWPLTLSTPWMHADLESILWKFGGDPAICVREEAILQTDGQTDRRRTPHHCISSFLEWTEN